MKAKLRQKCPFSYKATLSLLLLSLSQQASSAEPPAVPSGDFYPTYEILEKKANILGAERNLNGWTYLLSGGLALGISVPSYFLSEDVSARVIYTLGEALGIAAVSYGAYEVLVQDDLSRFKNTVNKVPHLTTEQKNQLAQGFLEESALQARSKRKIQVIGHSLSAALNGLSAATTSNSELRTAQFILLGINLFAAIKFGLTESEAEKLVQKENRLEVFLGPMAGVHLRF